MQLLKQLTLERIKERYPLRDDIERSQYDANAVRVRILMPDGLRAHVVGPRAYTVVIREQGDELLTACTCPYHLDHDGDCKHIVATLMAWALEPETFKPMPYWYSALAHKSHGELLAILIDICETHPHLVDEYGLSERTRPNRPYLFRDNP